MINLLITNLLITNLLPLAPSSCCWSPRRRAIWSDGVLISVGYDHAVGGITASQQGFTKVRTL
jgi:hypothetical protein